MKPHEIEVDLESIVNVSNIILHIYSSKISIVTIKINFGN